VFDRAGSVSGEWARLLSELPEELVEEGYRTGNGEPLWGEESARTLVEWLRRRDRGLRGGEVYASTGPMQTSFVSDWETEPTGEESWHAFVIRAAAVALEEIGTGARPGRRFYLAIFDNPGGDR
jgi:hypothetical protein